MIRALALLVVALAGGGGSAAAKPCGDEHEFGFIRSFEKKGGHYELRFDPAWYLTGVTANTAAAEDGVIPKGQPMPNDNYVVNESRRTYLYYVSPSAHVTVLTPKSIVAGTTISPAQLIQLVHGKKPVKLFEGLETGFWIRYHNDMVCELRQQYHP